MKISTKERPNRSRDLGQLLTVRDFLAEELRTDSTSCKLSSQKSGLAVNLGALLPTRSSACQAVAVLLHRASITGTFQGKRERGQRRDFDSSCAGALFPRAVNHAESSQSLR